MADGKKVADNFLSLLDSYKPTSRPNRAPNQSIQNRDHNAHVLLNDSAHKKGIVNVNGEGLAGITDKSQERGSSNTKDKKVSENFLLQLDDFKCSSSSKTTNKLNQNKGKNTQSHTNRKFGNVHNKKDLEAKSNDQVGNAKLDDVIHMKSNNNEGNRNYGTGGRDRGRGRGGSNRGGRIQESSSVKQGEFGGGCRGNRMMGFKFLESLLDREPSEVLTTLANPRSGFQELVNDRPIRKDLLLLIIKVLSIVNESGIDQLKMQILSETIKPEFIDEIKKFCSLICVEDNKDRLKSIVIFFGNILNLFDSIVDMFPSLMNEKLKSTLVTLHLSMKNAKDEQGVDVPENLFQLLRDINDQITSYAESKKKADQIQHQGKGKESQQVPNNFRELPLVPTVEDFLVERSFLRQNIVQGSYRDVDHYLDVQFRLLREDFIAPLRTGIHEYVESLAAPHLKRKYSSVKIYPKVQFVESCKSRDVFGFRILFDCDRKLPRNINWDYNKRFMVGSLLLFSDDNFRTFYLATVVDRNIDQLSSGRLMVAFVPNTEVPSYLFEPNQFFVMAESEVYYEAYRHVLYALTRMDDKNFPMKQYIVEVDTAGFPPLYIINKSQYEISGYSVNLLDDDRWPSPDMLKLNPSQHHAFKSALTNDFVVIQGPPGTGKTFLALKITQVLLENNVSEGTPIVIVCYTNHALDQFLEGILKYTKRLIRIGSQCQDENLQKYNIDQIRREERNSRSLSSSPLFRSTMSQKAELQEKLKHLECKIYELSFPTGILDLEVLRSVINFQQFNELKGQEVEWLLCHDVQDYCTQYGQPLGAADQEKATSGHDQQRDMFDGITEFQTEGTDVVEGEEEMDDEENAKRLADMMEDDFSEDFITEENYTSRVKYALSMEELNYAIGKGNYNLSIYPENSPERFQIMVEIQELECRLNFMKRKLEAFNYFQFNQSRLEVFQNIKSIWELSPNDRWQYYMTWIHLYCCQLKQVIQNLTDSYQKILLLLNELRQLEDLSFVRNAAVIGLTTSGAAKRRILLENLDTKIVIVEEAAEVLEAHIVTSLTKSVQHVILIGDHQQLRPNPNVYLLAKKYNMEVSLFERMLRNGLGCCALDVQHRMRPEIASLIVPTIYPSLMNHPTTMDRPKVTGIDKFVFFLTHNHPEDQLPDSSSRQNKFEADFLIALCQHLMLQGYQPTEITILATYTGQVWYMRKEKRRLTLQNPDWKFVRITPVDNFQGEENRIILLSLVRSNSEARIGFLSTENRVCVALSRAREGLYIVGNMDNLTASSAIWPKIKQQLDNISAIGRQLTLRCDRHPDQLTQVQHAKDFSKLSEGGCTLMCNFELDCDHVCPRKCHIIDKEHVLFKCQQACDRPPCKVEGHKCPLFCWQDCQPCAIQVEKQLPCGHSAKLPCHMEPAAASCKTLVPTVLPACDHTVDKPCHLPVEEQRCTEPCLMRLPCGHSCNRHCHVKDDPDHIDYKCIKDCIRPNALCRHNHICKKLCYEECGECMEPVKTILPCGHREKIHCKDDPETYFCKKRCTKKLPCGHECPLSCGLPCSSARCLAMVDKECEWGHPLKNMRCYESAKQRKCFADCSRKLPCGHDCSSKCSTDCASVTCQVLVPSPVRPACNHDNIQIPCHLSKLDLNRGSDELLQLCKADCREKLACGHTCSGACGQCLQGRLHVPCKKICNKMLICGHSCKADCSTLCPPCNSKDCLRSCPHVKKCDKKTHPCSNPCEPCSKPCVWQCEHHKCSKRCGEECNRPVCDKPCVTQLECGHACIGFCGEVHPPLCRQCDADSPVIAADPTARFVVLEDCGHVVESRRLEELRDAATRTAVVSLMRCPECQVPVVRTKRYRSVFNRFRSQMVEVNKLVNSETARFRNIQARKVKIFDIGKEPTTSPSMNELLAQCFQALRGIRAEQSQLIISCILHPLAVRCFQLKEKGYIENQSGVRELNGEEEQRLKLRLEYLAGALRPWLKQISYTAITQLELEVARIMFLLEKPYNVSGNLWYDPSSFTWERHRTLMQIHNLQPAVKISGSLRTLDAVKQWYRCDKEHLYVADDNETCSTCREAEEAVREEEECKKKVKIPYVPPSRRRNEQEEHNKPIQVSDFRNIGKKGKNKNRRGNWQKKTPNPNADQSQNLPGPSNLQRGPYNPPHPLVTYEQSAHNNLLFEHGFGQGQFNQGRGGRGGGQRFKYQPPRNRQRY